MTKAQRIFKKRLKRLAAQMYRLCRRGRHNEAAYLYAKATGMVAERKNVIVAAKPQEGGVYAVGLLLKEEA